MVEGGGALRGRKLAIKYPDIELTRIVSTHNSLARILHEDSKPQGGGSAVLTGQQRTESMASTIQTCHECLAQDLAPKCSVNTTVYPLPFPGYEQIMVK